MQPSCPLEEHVLNDIVHVRFRAHAARDERKQLGLQVAPGTARRCVAHASPSGAQQDGPQQDFVPPGFTASIVAEAT